MKNTIKILTTLCISAFVFSCHNTNSPNYQYFPNMYESVGYETYQESDAFANGQEAQIPAKGTLKRGFVPYGLPNSNEGYEASKLVTTARIDSTVVDMEKSKELYNIYCAICHGEKGNGKGYLVEREKILGVPSYADRTVTVGSIYHVLTYGLNSMGAYSNQLNQKERWMVSQYVLKLKSEL